MSVVNYKPASVSSRSESSNAQVAFEDYWALGSGRSVDLLYKSYEKRPNGPPCSQSTLHAWKSMFQWDKRVAQRSALASAEVEHLRRQQIADMETELYRKGMDLLTKAADNVLSRLADYEAGNTRAIGALAAVQAVKLGAELATRGQRQPMTITREEVVNRGGDNLTLDTFLELLPEGVRDQILEAAYWELQSRGDSESVRGDSRPAAELPDAT